MAHWSRKLPPDDRVWSDVIAEVEAITMTAGRPPKIYVLANNYQGVLDQLTDHVVTDIGARLFRPDMHGANTDLLPADIRDKLVMAIGVGSALRIPLVGLLARLVWRSRQARKALRFGQHSPT